MAGKKLTRKDPLAEARAARAELRAGVANAVNDALPVVGSDSNAWGTKLNQFLIDTLVLLVSKVSSINGVTPNPSTGDVDLSGTVNNLADARKNSNTLMLRAVSERLSQMEKGTVTQLRWAVTGTSVANRKYVEYYSDLLRLAGGVSGFIGIFSGNNGVTAPRSGGGLSFYGDTGSPTQTPTNDVTVWPGQTVSFSAATGDSRKWGNTGASTTYDNAEVGFIGGGGVVSVQVGTGTAQTVDTSAMGAGVLVPFAATVPGRAKQDFTVTAVSGVTKIAYVGLWDSTVAGLLVIGQYAPGLTYSALTTQAKANYQTYLARYLPDMITWEAKGGQWQQADLVAMLNSIQAATPSSDVLLIGSTPDDGGAVPGGSSGTDQLSYNRLADTIARTYQPTLNVFSWDGYSPLGSWANVVALDALCVAHGGTVGDWKNDGIHLGWRAQSYLAQMMWRDVGLDRLFREKTGATQGWFTKTLSMGRTFTAPVFQLIADATFDLDIAVYLKRALTIYAAGSVTPYFQMDPVRSNQSFIPSTTQLGSGGPTIQAKSVVITQSISDATTKIIDVSAAAGADVIANVTLIGNVSANWSISGNTGAGQKIYLSLIEDATGGRTLGTPAGAIRVRTGFAIDTTALHRTTLILLSSGSGGRIDQMAQEVQLTT